MRRGHLDAFRPICPLCRRLSGLEHPLVLTTVAEERGDHVIHGTLGCPSCLREYPILDGVPLLVTKLREYVAGNERTLMDRRDLPDSLRSLFGDCLGGDADRDRQVQSAYCRDHFGEYDPEDSAEPRPGQAAGLLGVGLPLLPDLPAGLTVELGCAAGGTAMALASAYPDRLVLGLDLNFGLVQRGLEVLQTGQLSYDRRRVGIVYERRRFPVSTACADRVDLWVADAADTPLRSGSAALACALNVVDSIYDPSAFIAEIRRLCASDGAALLTSPFDWSTAATKTERWLGGHSQRSTEKGSSRDAVVRAMGQRDGQSEAMRLMVERDGLPWKLQMHDRGHSSYLCWLGIFGR